MLDGPKEIPQNLIPSPEEVQKRAGEKLAQLKTHYERRAKEAREIITRYGSVRDSETVDKITPEALAADDAAEELLVERQYGRQAAGERLMSIGSARGLIMGENRHKVVQDVLAWNERWEGQQQYRDGESFFVVNDVTGGGHINEDTYIALYLGPASK